jgi:uncharacterized protein YkwD
MIDINQITFNWVDLAIVALFTFFIYEGFKHGFFITLADFLSFFGSLILALSFYPELSDLLTGGFSVSPALSNALGFLIIAIMSEMLLGYISSHIIDLVPKKIKQNRLNKYLSILPSFGKSMMLITFLIVLIVGLPLSTRVKVDMSESYLGSKIIVQTHGTEKIINDVFGGVVEESITYLTINPKSYERVVLTATPTELTVDEGSEKRMFELVNEERGKAGAQTLFWDPELVVVARTHATDMWEKKYFGHISLTGEDVGDRLERSKYEFILAGENLALASTVTIAHKGLMNSEGHRTNIMDPNFEKVGIGVIDNGVFGKMFVQVFVK